MKRKLRFGACQLLPGVEKLLSTFSNVLSEPPSLEPIKVGIASSSLKSLFDVKTMYLSLGRWFRNDSCVFIDYPVTQGDGRKAKPAPDLFLTVLDRINKSLTATWSKGSDEKAGSLIAPAECLVVEDSIAGVAAGRAAGMRVCWVPHKGLREVCRGMEQMVLEGKLHEVEDMLMRMEYKIKKGEAKELEDIRNTCDDQEKCGEEAIIEGMESVVSKDGWAEMISSLEHFDYDRYGIMVGASWSSIPVAVQGSRWYPMNQPFGGHSFTQFLLTCCT